MTAAPTTAPRLIELEIAPHTNLVMLWGQAAKLLSVAIMRSSAHTPPRSLMSCTVHFNDLARGVEIDAGSLGMQFHNGPLVNAGTPFNLRAAGEWLRLHGLETRRPEA